MSTNFGRTLSGVLSLENLAAYGAGLVIAAETDEAVATVVQRWQRWTDGKGLKTLEKLSEDLEILGWEIVIRKK
jgi:hypothetical protein